MTAKKAPKPLFLIWNDDLDEPASSSFFDTLDKAKKEADDFHEEYSYCIYECKLVAAEAGRSIIWKAPQ